MAATDVDLAIPAPKGFKIAHQQQTDTQRIMEFIPGTETLENWTDMVTYHSARVQGKDPAELFAFLEGKYREMCRNVIVKKPAAHTVNGYKVVIGDLGCGGKQDATGEGEYTRFMILSTPVAVHQVQRAWRGKAFGADQAPLSAAQLKDWDQFFASVGVCRPAAGGQPKCEYLDK